METNKSPVDNSNIKTPTKTKRNNKLRDLSTLVSKFSPTQCRPNSSDNNKSALNPEKLLNRLEHSVCNRDDRLEKIQNCRRGLGAPQDPCTISYDRD